MFIITIEQAIDDDFFGHWELHAAWALGGFDPEQAMYEALHRWIKDSYHGDIHECLHEIEIDDNDLRVTVSLATAPGPLTKVWQEQFVPLDWWTGRGRCVCTAPAHCTICNWYGSVAKMDHYYRLNSQNEIEPTDLCPQCGATLL